MFMRATERLLLRNRFMSRAGTSNFPEHEDVAVRKRVLQYRYHIVRLKHNAMSGWVACNQTWKPVKTRVHTNKIRNELDHPAAYIPKIDMQPCPVFTCFHLRKRHEKAHFAGTGSSSSFNLSSPTSVFFLPSILLTDVWRRSRLPLSALPSLLTA